MPPGVDGVTFEVIEAQGVETLLAQLRDELTGRTYQPLPAHRTHRPGWPAGPVVGVEPTRPAHCRNDIYAE